MSENNPYQNPTPWPTARRNGLVCGLLLIGYFLISNLLGFDSSAPVWTQVISVAATTLIFMFTSHRAIISYRDEELNGVIPFGKAFGVSILNILVGLLLALVFTYIFMKFIDRSIVENAQEVAYEKMAETDLDDEEFERASQIIGYATGPGVLALSSFFLNLLWGAIVALGISAAVPSNNTKLSEENESEHDDAGE